MTFGLLLTTLITSATDSLNPFAITQQFVLQGMVKKPGHIWYFIWATAITNFIGSLLAYYGLLGLFSNLWHTAAVTFGSALSHAGLVLGVLLMLFGAWRAYRKIKKAGAPAAGDEEAARRKIKSVAPLALYALGTAATIAELATAMPLFAFMAVLLNHRLTLWELIIILGVYNLIYASPLMLLYFIYVKKQALFDRAYTAVKSAMEKSADFLIAALLFAAGAFWVIRFFLG